MIQLWFVSHHTEVTNCNIIGLRFISHCYNSVSFMLACHSAIHQNWQIQQIDCQENKT